MPLVGAWCKVWIYFGFVFGWTKAARPRFDTSTDMGLVLVPADAEVDSVIFRLRATDQDADFPLVFEVTATITPVVRIDNLPCTLYNKVCQANVILTKRLTPGRLHDFAVRVRDTKGDSNSMQATISVTNATTLRDKIFPHIPSLIMVPEDTKPGKELDYLLVRANSRSGKPVYIELWQPKELFTIRQRQTPTQTRGVITLIGELDFETQSMYTLTLYATDPYTEPGKDTRNIAGLNVVVVVQDVQDVPPIFTLAPPLTRINNSVQPGDVIVRVHAEDGDKGVPREITYGLVSEGNPFTPFFNISETSGEITLARPLEELTQITHVGAPVVLTVVAEEIRRSREEPPAQATVVEVGFLLGEPGNSPPYFESDNYVAFIDENPEPGTVISFPEQYTTRVRDEDIGKAGVFALKLENNNGTFEINPTVAERTADFIITVRDNALIDYETYRSLTFKIVAQEVGPATNLSTSVPATIFLRDVNDNPPVFDEESYEVTLSENVTAGTRVIQVHATDKDTGLFGSIQYTRITGQGSEAFTMDPDTGLITVAMGTSLDREMAPRLVLSIEARDENGNGNRGVVPLIVNLIDVNDNAPLFEKEAYEFTLNSDLTNFTTPAIIRAIDADAEPPNNEVRYELIHGNYENKFNLNEITGELTLRSPITKVRRRKQSAYDSFAKNGAKEFVKAQDNLRVTTAKPVVNVNTTKILDNHRNRSKVFQAEDARARKKRANSDALYTLTARAYDLGVPHLSSVTQIRVVSGAAMEARIVMFVVPGEHPDSTKTAETLAAITGGRVTVLETRPYQPQNQTHGTGGTVPIGGKRSIVVARVEQTEPGTPLVDLEKIRETLAANGVGIISGSTTDVSITTTNVGVTYPPAGGNVHTSDGQTTNINYTATSVHNEEVTVYKAENKLLFWLLIILGLLMLLAIAALIICCICPGCPFYMAPRKRRVHSSETLVVRSDGRPKRHLHRKPAAFMDGTWNGRKQAWSADPTRRNWQFNRRNTKNCGLASLPGDVAYISGHPNDVQVNVESLTMRDGPYDPSRRNRIDEQERMYVEDVEDQKIRGYDTAELDSLQRHEVERGSDVPRQGYRQRYIEPEANEEATVREQHFYREGNAEVLRLVTRGQVDDSTHHRHHHPTTFIVDGKDILLRRFMEDQKSREELSMQELEAARSMESHQRSKEMLHQQQEIILIPEKLDLGHRQHVDELGPSIQRLVIDHAEYEPRKADSHESREAPRKQEKQESTIGGPSSMIHAKDHAQGAAMQTYSFHDLELARQNALLTRLLLEREGRQVTGGVADSTSYLETQSLPGQVAIATQTDRTAATQTERQVRSRSDNDESDEDSRHRKKLKSKKRYGDGDWRRPRTLWMKSPIEEEENPCFDKRLSILRKKVKEVKEGRKVSLEPEVLREISDSLDGNGSSYPAEEEQSTKMYQRSTEQTIKYKIVDEGENGSPSSLEACKERYEGAFGEKARKRESGKADKVESPSSPEIGVKGVKYGRSKASERSPRKETKSKEQRKVEGIVKPSFRILEREITMLTKKLSKLGEKKFQESSDSGSHDKSEPLSKEPKKDSSYRSSKRTEDSSSRTHKKPGEFASSASKASMPDQATGQRKEASVTKTRQKLKYQQSHVLSPGSSEYEEVFEKHKQSPAIVQEAAKQKQPSQSHVKVKRQIQVERREHKRQTAYQDQELDKRKDASTKDAFRSEKPEKSTRLPARAPKLVNVPRKEHVSEDTSTSTDRNETRKVPPVRRDADKKSSLESSSTSSTQGSQRKPRKIVERASERLPQDSTKQPEKRELVHQGFSDDFVAQSEHRKTVHEEQDRKEMSDARRVKDSTSVETIPRVYEAMTGRETKSVREATEIARVPIDAEELHKRDLMKSAVAKKESDSGESSSNGEERHDEIRYTRFEPSEIDESQEQKKEDILDDVQKKIARETPEANRMEERSESSNGSARSARKKKELVEEESEKIDKPKTDTEKQITETDKDVPKEYKEESFSTITKDIEVEPEKKVPEDREESKILHDSEKPIQTIVPDESMKETKESELLNGDKSDAEKQLHPSVDTKTEEEIEKHELEKEKPVEVDDSKVDHLESTDEKSDDRLIPELPIENVSREVSTEIEKIEEKEDPSKDVIKTEEHKEADDTPIDVKEAEEEITTIVKVPEEVKTEPEKAEAVTEMTKIDEAKDIIPKPLSESDQISSDIAKRTTSPTDKSTNLVMVTSPVSTEDDKESFSKHTIPRSETEIQKPDTANILSDVKGDEIEAIKEDTESTKTIDKEVTSSLPKDFETDPKTPEILDDKTLSPTEVQEKMDMTETVIQQNDESTSEPMILKSSQVEETLRSPSSKVDTEFQESSAIEPPVKSEPTTTLSAVSAEKKPEKLSSTSEAIKPTTSAMEMLREEKSHAESVEAPRSSDPSESIDVTDKIAEEKKPEVKSAQLPSLMDSAEIIEATIKMITEEKLESAAIKASTMPDSPETIEKRGELKVELEPRESSGISRPLEDRSFDEKGGKAVVEDRDKSLEEEPTEVEEKRDKKSGLTEEELRAEEEPAAGKYGDVSLPLFSSIIDTLGDSDDSDSSSDVSRKTTLTTRPYHTPRHRAPRSPEKAAAEGAGKDEVRSDESDVDSILAADFEDDEDFETMKVEKQDELLEEVIAAETVAGESDAPNKDPMKAKSEDEQDYVPQEHITSSIDIEPAHSQELEKLKSSTEPDIQSSTSEKDKTESTTGKSREAMHLKLSSEPDQKSTMNIQDREDIEDLKVEVEEPDDVKATLISEKRSSEDTQDQARTEKSDNPKSGSDSDKSRTDRVGTISLKTDSRKPDDSKSSSGSDNRSSRSTKDQADASSSRIKTQKPKKELKDEATSPLDAVPKSTIPKTSGKSTKPSGAPKTLPPKEKAISLDETSDEKRQRGRVSKQAEADQKRQKDAEVLKPARKKEDDYRQRQSATKAKQDKEKKSSSDKSSTTPKTSDIDTSKTQSKYMSWYKKKREEMERRRAETKAAEEEELLPRWLRRSMKHRKSKEERKKDPKTPEMTPRTRRKVKPLVNVESEQLKAIVRQGRKLRKAEGGANEDPPIQIFATSPPPAPETKHHLVQHSEYKYERIPPPFYLHPPPAPHSSPQMSPEHFEAAAFDAGRPGEDIGADITVPLQGAGRLRHQQLLEKKSVFDIAYNEAAPSQLRADSTTPPS